MDVLDRWREFERNLVFDAVVNERRLRHYTARIFGPMGYRYGGALRIVAGRIAFAVYVALDRFAKGMARHGLFP